MSKSKLAVTCAALAMGALATTAWAQAAKPAGAPPAATAAPAPDPFEQVLAAKQVAEFARREKDVQAMIVAARMLRQVPFHDAGAAAPTQPAPAGKPPAAEFTPEGLFAEARGLAKGDQPTLMQISVAQSSPRGVLTSVFGRGLVRIVQEVGARAVYAFPIEAQAGALLRIGAIGDVKSRIGMRLRDLKGRMLCNDGGDYAPVCSFKPSGATGLRVEILNQGDNSTRAVILSN